jgi:hypothetical protein
MYRAVNKVKIYACNAVTKISKTEIKRVSKTETELTRAVSNMKINEMRLKTMM